MFPKYNVCLVNILWPPPITSLMLFQLFLYIYINMYTYIKTANVIFFVCFLEYSADVCLNSWTVRNGRAHDREVSTCLSVSSPLLCSISAVRTRVQSNFCFVSYVMFCVSVFLILFFICIVQSLNKLVMIQGAHLDCWKISNSVARLGTLIIF